MPATATRPRRQFLVVSSGRIEASRVVALRGREVKQEPTRESWLVLGRPCHRAWPLSHMPLLTVDDLNRTANTASTSTLAYPSAPIIAWGTGGPPVCACRAEMPIAPSVRQGRVWLPVVRDGMGLPLFGCPCLHLSPKAAKGGPLDRIRPPLSTLAALLCDPCPRGVARTAYPILEAPIAWGGLTRHLLQLLHVQFD